MTFSICPQNVEDLAEEYCLGRLESEAAEAFEDHYITCPACAVIATETIAFIEAFRAVDG